MKLNLKTWTDLSIKTEIYALFFFHIKTNKADEKEVRKKLKEERG
jgi:hypothetical protein